MLASRQKRRVVALALVVVLAVALAASDVVHSHVDRLLALAAAQTEGHPSLGVLVFVVASVLSAMVAFFSSSLVAPVAIYAWGEAWTVLLLWLSWWSGGCCSYAIGRCLGRRIADWLLPRETLEFYAARLSARAGFFMIVLFQVALPSEVPGYVLGTLRYRFAVYAAALALAELPFAFGTVYLGESFLERNYALMIGLGIGGIVASALAFTHLHRRLDERAPE